MKNYAAPSMEITKFETANVLLDASQPGSEPEDVINGSGTDIRPDPAPEFPSNPT